jgi:hypothetical protein
MTLPEGWELDDDGFPRPIRKRSSGGKRATRLSDLLIDEISFVERGANQRSHVVLTKADGSPEPKEPTVEMEVDPYGDAAIRYDIAKELTAIFEADPKVYDRQYVVKQPEQELGNLLGAHQRLMAALREAALSNTSSSLYQRLIGPEVAAAYDAVYGRPTDDDARAT